jgi:hypothetical protein
MQAFDSFLEGKGILRKYSIVPFIKNHPVHLSLYLTTYDNRNIPKITEAVRRLSGEMSRFKIRLTSIEASASNFVMLDVDNSRNADGSNNLLQIYSDKVVASLQDLRYKKSAIPVWANAFPEKRKAFELYGSPNVYMQFSPHFSILAANVSPEQQRKYNEEIKSCIEEFSLKVIEAQAISLCVGYVDRNGQVTEEIASFSLKP